MKKSLFLSLTLLSLSKAIQAAENTRLKPLQAQEVTITTTDGITRTLSEDEFNAAQNAETHPVAPETTYFGTLKACDSFGSRYSVHFVEGLNSKHDKLAVLAAGFTGNASPDMYPHAQYLRTLGIDCIFIGRSHDAVPHERVKPGGNIYGGRWGDALSTVLPGNLGHVVGYLLRPSTWTEFGGPAARIAKEQVPNINRVLDHPIELEDPNGNKLQFDATTYKKLFSVSQAFGAWEAYEVHRDRTQKGLTSFDVMVVDSVPLESPFPVLPGFSKYSFLAALTEAQKPVQTMVVSGDKDTLCSEADQYKILQASANNSLSFRCKSAYHIGLFYGNRPQATNNKEERVNGMAAVFGGLMQRFVKESTK